jgi:hypothetical protein
MGNTFAPKGFSTVSSLQALRGALWSCRPERISIKSRVTLPAGRVFCASDVPGHRFTMPHVFVSFLHFREHAARNTDGSACRGPAGVKGEVGDRLDQLLARDAVLQREL